MIRSTLSALAVAGLALAPAGSAVADSGAHAGSGAAFTYAVYGDAPYGTSPTDTSETDATPGFIDKVNADPAVTGVVHVGDIHSGSQYCTESYDETIAGLWSRFADPLVYTPGDNEWADCHKKKEGGGAYDPTTGEIAYVEDADGNPVDYASGNPVANLDLVRRIFFRHPGGTLGSGGLAVTSQATAFDPAHPEDAAYVENVRWERHGIVFVSLNIPGGSDNDADPWYGAPSETDQQQAERTARTAADLRWLDAGFAAARTAGAAGVVVITQADMWDLDGKPATHLAGYEPFVKSLADHTTALGRPVLLLNGDSHVYRSDDPLAPGAPCTGDAGVCGYDAWQSHPSYDVANLHRITVHGSTIPLEYLRLTADPGRHYPSTDTATGGTFGPFSWTRVTD